MSESDGSPAGPTGGPPGDGGRFVTVRDPSLSLWQAAAEQAVRRAGAGDASRADLLSHPVVQGVATHAAAADRGHGLGILVDHLRTRAERQILAHLSKHFFEHAHGAVAEGGPWHRIEERIRNAAGRFEADLLAKLGARRFGSLDPLWVECALIYAGYWAESGGELTYRDWKVDGGSDLTYGVVGYRLPVDAKIAVIGDWGTGLDDAEALLIQIMAEQGPTAILHLGDVYYAGTREECQFNFLDVFERVFKNFGRIPVFTIPGNHDYYDWGIGFYELIDKLNAAGDPSWRQQASYFCLRTADDGWQFLGMDTGQGDADPLHKDAAPRLRDSEVEWLLDKIDRFPGRTVLLSHHQVFSSHSTIDGASTDEPYLNRALLDTFKDRLGHVAAWYWGHEHNLALYADDLFGVSKGRLVGSSAFEESGGEDPYRALYPEKVPFRIFAAGPVKAGKVGEFYNHSYAVIDLNAPGGASASYYQIPSWGGGKPVLLPPDQVALLATETLGGSR